MEDKVIHERYRELACAVIMYQVKKYLEPKNKMTDYELYCFIQNCNYFDYLGIDRDYFYVKCLKIKNEQRSGKQFRRRDYGNRKKKKD